jgi:hypothetical protein
MGRWLLLILLLAALSLSACVPRAPTWVELSEGSAGWFIDSTRYQASAHGNMACADCHPEVKVDDPWAPHPNQDLLRTAATALYDYQACAQCHTQEYAAYAEGAHAEARQNPGSIKSDNEPPTCGHCHDTHYAVAGRSRAELMASTSESCGQCHLPQLTSYKKNYHGQAAALYYGQSASCADCHGAHLVSALATPEQAVVVCRRCHPEANINMAGFLIHAEETLSTPPDAPRAGQYALLFWVRLFFTLLVVGVLTLFYAHTLLWLLRDLHRKLKEQRQ